MTAALIFLLIALGLFLASGFGFEPTGSRIKLNALGLACVVAAALVGGATALTPL